MIFNVFLAGFTKENATMALNQSVLSDLLDALRSGGDLDFMREAMQLVLQSLIDLEANEVIGAARYERSDARTTHRNGSRSRLLSTKAGDVALAIPKSMLEICRDHSSNVKRWRNGQMVLRWCAAGIEASKQFRRVNGFLHLPALRAALTLTSTGLSHPHAIMRK